MEVLSWFQQLNVHALSLADLKSESSLFILYALVCYFIKSPVFLLAFFMCFLLINASFTQGIKEYQVYLIVMVMYSYLYDEYKNYFYKISCGILIFISLVFSIDALLYGLGGYFDEAETVIYNNIGSIALCSHLIFISSLIDHRRIQHYLRSFFDCIERITYNSYNMQYILSTINQKGAY